MQDGGADYAEFQDFLRKFQTTIDPEDQLPIRVSNYTITRDEFKPEVVNFARQYLQENDCPTVLLNAIVKDVLADVEDPSKESALHSGFEAIQNTYQPLKLMQAVISKVNSVCLRLLDNAELMKLLPESSLAKTDSNVVKLPKYAALGVKNSRRKMEDRHVVIQDIQDMYPGQKSPRCCYYALFDGHGGAEAAIYSVAHLSYYLRNSINFPEDPETAITEAFTRTDQAIISKYESDSFRSGTTALVVLHFPEDNMMHVAWAGDSQALLVKNGETVQIVNSHKASRESERNRVISAGGEIFPLQGIDRVMGQLAITRAIGDTELKPYITSEPEILSFELDGEEDFLIMGSDGLWDGVSEDAAASEVYNRLKEDPDCYETIPKRLVQLAKEGSSSDNITVIVVYLKDISQIAKFSWPSADTTQPLESMETTNTNTDPMAFESSNQEHFNGLNGSATATMNNNKFIDETIQGQDMAFDGNDNLLNFDSQTTTTTTTTNKTVMDVDDLMNENNLLMDQHQQPIISKGFDNEFGPETDVDAVDEAMLMSSPHSVSQEDDLPSKEMQFEQKEVDFTESSMVDEPLDQFIEPEFNTGADQEPTRNMFGLPKEVLGVADDDGENVLESIPVDYDGAASGAEGAAVSDEDLLQDPENNSSGEQLVGLDETGPAAALDVDLIGGIADPAATAKPVANVDSECESDDEWNYVKQPETTEEQPDVNLLGETAPEYVEKKVTVEEESEKVQEQHAEAQAIAESQEHCTELNIENSTEDQLLLPESDQQQQQQQQHQPEPVLVDDLVSPDSAISPLSVDTAESGVAEELVDEDMSSQLNPDAVEFVPLSPQNSAPVSPLPVKMDQDPFLMGQTPQIAAIMDGDRILAQSPRKNSGTVQLDNVVIPDEQEFDAEIENRPHEWSADLLGKKIDLNGSLNGAEAPLSPEDDEDAGTLNSKEERDLDEGKEELRDELIKEIMDNIPTQNGHSAEQTNGLSAETVPGEQDPMNMSFHQDVQVAPIGGNPFDLNAVQLLPDDDIEEEDEQSKGEAQVEQRFEQMTLQSGTEAPVEDQPQMELTESENNFMMQQPEAEEPERKEFDEKDEEALEEQKPAEIEVCPPGPVADDVPVDPTVAPAQDPLPEPAPEMKPAEEVPVAEVAAVAVAAAAAVATTAAVTASKAKPATTATPKKAATPAKKDLATTPKPKTPTTLGVKASPAAAKTTPSRVGAVSKASPTVAARTSTAKTSSMTTRSPLVEKKAATPTSATAAKKPATPTRPTTAARTPTTPSRTTATRTSLAPTAASPKTTTTSRVSATKPTSTVGAAGVKRTPPTTTGTASRTLTKTTTTSTTSAAAARPKTVTGVATTTTTVKKTTVTSSLAAKPKTTTTTTTTSRLMNGTAAKTATTSRVSPTTKTTTTTTRAPLSTRPSTATAATTAAKKPLPGSASARAGAVSAPSSRLTATKRVPLAGKTTTTTTKTSTTAAAPAAAKGTKPVPITKRNVESVKTTTTTTTTKTVVVENGGDGAALLLNGGAELIVNGGNHQEVNGEGHVEPVEGSVEGQKMVIDLTAD